MEINELAGVMEAVEKSHSSLSDSELDFSKMESTTISGQLRIGYFSMDRSCQTEATDVKSLKETTSLLSELVQEMKLLKRDVSYTKMSLKSACEIKIEARATELYKRINEGLGYLEKQGDKRYQYIRHSFRTQLENAITRMAHNYQQSYAGLSQKQQLAHQAEMDKIQQAQEEQKRTQKAQQELIDMMSLQMNSATVGEEGVPDNSEARSVTPVAIYLQEIEELKSVIATMESQRDDMKISLSESRKENKKLKNELEKARTSCSDIQNKHSETKKKLMDLQILLENERKTFQKMMSELKADLENRHNTELRSLQEKIDKDTAKKIKDLESQQAQKLKNIEALNEQKIKEMQKRPAVEHKGTSTDKVKISAATEPPKVKETRTAKGEERDIDSLRALEKKHAQEIARLQKELEKTKRAAEIKIGILQQQIHSLKDEMYIRLTLYRQSAKVQLASVLYTMSDESATGILEPCPKPEAQKERQNLQQPSIPENPTGVVAAKSLTSDSIKRSSLDDQGTSLLSVSAQKGPVEELSAKQ